MKKRSFFGLKQPRFKYEAVHNADIKPVRIDIPQRATLFLNRPHSPKASLNFKIGDRVKTGQKIVLFTDSDEYVISSVTGTLRSFESFTGDFGQLLTAITIEAEKADEFDDAFQKALEEGGIAGVGEFLGSIPGGLPPGLIESGHVDTLVVCGIEQDLLSITNQVVTRSSISAMNRGISAIKKITGVHKVVMALPQSLIQTAGAIGGASGVELRVIDDVYPSANPRLIMRDVMGQVVPVNKSPEDLGIFFINAEAIAAIGKAVEEKKLPVTKTLTLIKKDMTKVLVEARIGTPFNDIFQVLDITLFDRDRIIVGGPMSGSTVYSEDHPVGPRTLSIMIQDSADVPLVSDYPCINCGECVRICPADIPVNMLVRFLEARQYETAADEYDLYSCIECGLCSFICPSKIPIFQYIHLGKFELDRIRAEERMQAPEPVAETTEETAAKEEEA
jgi:Na+-translocating ferredoxin:NAD+ oxidoreductase subunit C